MGLRTCSPIFYFHTMHKLFLAFILLTPCLAKAHFPAQWDPKLGIHVT